LEVRVKSGKKVFWISCNPRDIIVEENYSSHVLSKTMLQIFR